MDDTNEITETMGQQLEIPGTYVDDSELEGELDALLNDLSGQAVPTFAQGNTQQNIANANQSFIYLFIYLFIL
jgi:hypothetical protein